MSKRSRKRRRITREDSKHVKRLRDVYEDDFQDDAVYHKYICHLIDCCFIQDVSSSELVILLSLARLAEYNDLEKAFLKRSSYKRIAQSTKLSERSVATKVRSLVDRKILLRSEKGDGGRSDEPHLTTFIINVWTDR